MKYADEQIAIQKSRVQQLIAYLLLNRKAPQAKQYIAFQFWPDSSEKQARTNLRNVLYSLRKSVPNHKHYIFSNNKTLQWNTDSSWWLDVVAFENTIKKPGGQRAMAMLSGRHQKVFWILRYPILLLPLPCVERDNGLRH